MKYARKTIDHELDMHKQLLEKDQGTDQAYTDRLEQRIAELNAAAYLLQFTWTCEGCGFELGSRKLTGHRGCCPDAHYLPSLNTNIA